MSDKREPNGPVERAMQVILGQEDRPAWQRKALESALAAYRDANFLGGQPLDPDEVRATFIEGMDLALSELKFRVNLEEIRDKAEKDAAEGSPPETPTG